MRFFLVTTRFWVLRSIPIFVDLLQNEFREFAGLANRDDVTFVVDDARSFLSQSRTQFSVIQMALIDTWAATGRGCIFSV